MSSNIEELGRILFAFGTLVDMYFLKGWSLGTKHVRDIDLGSSTKDGTRPEASPSVSVCPTDGLHTWSSKFYVHVHGIPLVRLSSLGVGPVLSIDALTLGRCYVHVSHKLSCMHGMCPAYYANS